MLILFMEVLRNMELKFYVCEHCGNMVEMVKSSGVPMMCCGQKMTEIIPGTVDAAREKHVPVYEVTAMPCWYALAQLSIPCRMCITLNG